MTYFLVITQAYNIRHNKTFIPLTFDLDHTSMTSIQKHNIKLVGFDLGFQTKWILHFYELPMKIYEM
jgi:hypothetical protein